LIRLERLGINKWKKRSTQGSGGASRIVDVPRAGIFPVIKINAFQDGEAEVS
jgi:hypothetical protein